MLGVGSGSSWRFFAGGKHPCAKDYLHVGTETPLAAALNRWVHRGFRAQKVELRVAVSPMLWRFWLRGAFRGEIACGLLRESCDSIGRPFPLLLVGVGRVPPRPWQELPLQLAALWEQMEKLSAPGALDVKGFEQGLSALPAFPEELGTGADGEAGGELGLGEPDLFFLPLLHDAQGFLFLDLRHGLHEGRAFEEEVAAAGRCLRERIQAPPVGAFVGEKSGSSRYGVLTRPLRSADFAALWEPVSKG